MKPLKNNADHHNRNNQSVSRIRQLLTAANKRDVNLFMHLPELFQMFFGVLFQLIEFFFDTLNHWLNGIAPRLQPFFNAPSEVMPGNLARCRGKQ
jgi:hypothetical protein